MPVAEGALPGEVVVHRQFRRPKPLEARSLSAVEVAACSKAFSEGITAGGRGFSEVEDPGLLLRRGERERIYNRGGGKSNFFVFAWELDGRFRVFYSNPSMDPSLGRRDMLVVRDYDGRVPMGEWVDATLREVDGISRLKPDRALYVASHSHLGWVETDDGVRRVNDGGVSRDRDLIRHLMLYHRDVDATVCHNSFSADDYEQVQGKERRADILKVPGVEVTLPVAENDVFGPHFLVWFSDAGTAAEVQERLLEPKGVRRSRDIPSAALPLERMGMEFQDALNYLNGFRSEGRLAVGMSHPSGDRFVSQSGLWNAVSHGKLAVEDVVRIGRHFCDVIEMYNTEDIGIKFPQIPFSRRDGRFLRSVLKAHPEYGTRLTKDALCLLTPHIIREGWTPGEAGEPVKIAPARKSTSFGDDAHYFPAFGEKPRASLMAGGRSVIELAGDESKGGLTPESLVSAMRDGRMRGEASWETGFFGPKIMHSRKQALSVRSFGARSLMNARGIGLALSRYTRDLVVDIAEAYFGREYEDLK